MRPKMVIENSIGTKSQRKF